LSISFILPSKFRNIGSHAERNCREQREEKRVAWKSSWAVPRLAVGLIALSGCGAANAKPPRAPEKIYATVCGYCHGHNVGPVILGRQLPAEAIAQFVRRGQGAMPAFRQTEISDEELKALGAWIQASKGNPQEHGK
jgi:mono/diheme cytochrome c family protein